VTIILIKVKIIQRIVTYATGM